MLNFLLLSCLIVISLSALFSNVRQLQMLQQNSYFAKRYFNWLKDSFSPNLAILCIVFCLGSLLFTKKLFIPLLVLYSVLLLVRIILCVRTHKKSIKKLVFTARIKRLFATQILVLSGLNLLYAFFYDKLLGEICFIICVCISAVSPLLTYISWILTYPIEKLFARYYINDAKRILKRCDNLKVIGITGSYGKTTTKFILNRILSEKFNTVCTPQSFNTPMGVVRTVRSLIKADTQIFICEMGAKKRGDIKEICDIVKPTLSIITSVGPQHLDTFKSVENVYKTKFELFYAVKNAGGKTFVNAESKEILNRTDFSDTAIIPFALNGDYSYFAKDIVCSKLGSSFTLCLAGEEIKVTTKLLGLHAVSDILAAAAVAHYMGVTADQIRFAVYSLKVTEHRLELKPFFTKGLMIDDAYNSNPEGCLEAIRVLGSFEGMKKIIVTPGLIELGEKEYEANYNLGLEAAKYCDIIILVGENRSKPMRDAIATTDFDKENVFVVKSFADAMTVCTPIVDSNTVVLLENDLPDNYLN